MSKAKSKRICRKLSARLLFGVAMGATGVVTQALADFDPVIGLGSITAEEGTVFTGEAGDFSLGATAISAGDVNGDGLTDLLIGAPLIGKGGAPAGAGSAYIVFGKLGGVGATFQLSSLDGSNGFRLDGVNSLHRIGARAGTGGDINGDGFDDIVLGTPFGAPGGKQLAGFAYVVFGRASGFGPSLRLSKLDGNNGFRIDGRSAGDSAGDSVAIAGDINGDGIDDIALSSAGADAGAANAGSASVVFGRKSPWPAKFKLSDLNGKNGFRLNGAGANDYAGIVSPAGDFNGDGRDDLLVSALGADMTALNDTGAVYVLYGKDGRFPLNGNLSALTGSKGMTFAGSAANDKVGIRLSALGDVNGDGLDDFSASAPSSSPNGSNSGKAHVVYGRSSTAGLPISISQNGLTFRLEGTSEDRLGSAVGGGVDVNGDGFEDVIVGAPLADPSGQPSAGSSFVVMGMASGLVGNIATGSLDGDNGFRLDGAVAGDMSGISVSGAGDFNGDGFGDIIVGATGVGNGASTYAGVAYLLYGRAPESFVIRQGSAAGQYISGGEESDILAGLDGDDVLEGRGGAIDTLSGGIGTDTASYRHAPGAVVASLADNSANSGDATADVYDDIEGLEGSRFNDTLTGNDGANHLIGGLGRDRLKGGKGRDHFRYGHIRESEVGSAKRDVIEGFNPGKASTAVDVIDLRDLDANTAKNGNQKFRFVGTAAFTGKGQLRLKKTAAGIVLQANTRGGLASDFEILLEGVKNTSRLTARDFKL